MVTGFRFIDMIVSAPYFDLAINEANHFRERFIAQIHLRLRGNDSHHVRWFGQAPHTQNVTPAKAGMTLKCNETL